MTATRWFTVCTPEYDYTEPVLDDGSGPTYKVRDSVELRAADRQSALLLGMVALHRDGSAWLKEAEADPASPIDLLGFEVLDNGLNCRNCEDEGCPQDLHNTDGCAACACQNFEASEP